MSDVNMGAPQDNLFSLNLELPKPISEKYANTPIGKGDGTIVGQDSKLNQHEKLSLVVGHSSQDMMQAVQPEQQFNRLMTIFETLQGLNVDPTVAEMTILSTMSPSQPVIPVISVNLNQERQTLNSGGILSNMSQLTTQQTLSSGLYDVHSASDQAELVSRDPHLVDKLTSTVQSKKRDEKTENKQSVEKNKSSGSDKKEEKALENELNDDTAELKQLSKKFKEAVKEGQEELKEALDALSKEANDASAAAKGQLSPQTQTGVNSDPADPQTTTKSDPASKNPAASVDSTKGANPLTSANPIKAVNQPNEWFSTPNILVQFLETFSEVLKEAESNVMSQLSVQLSSITMSYQMAQDTGTQIKDSAKAQRDTLICEAVTSGISAGVAFVGAAMMAAATIQGPEGVPQEELPGTGNSQSSLEEIQPPEAPSPEATKQWRADNPSMTITDDPEGGMEMEDMSEVNSKGRTQQQEDDFQRNAPARRAQTQLNNKQIEKLQNNIKVQNKSIEEDGLSRGEKNSARESVKADQTKVEELQKQNASLADPTNKFELEDLDTNSKNAINKELADAKAAATADPIKNPNPYEDKAGITKANTEAKNYNEKFQKDQQAVKEFNSNRGAQYSKKLESITSKANIYTTFTSNTMSTITNAFKASKQNDIANADAIKELLQSLRQIVQQTGSTAEGNIKAAQDVFSQTVQAYTSAMEKLMGASDNIMRAR